MDLNIPGIISIGVFYLIILLVGILAARFVKYKDSDVNNTSSELSVVAGRSLHGVVGTFTMIATAVGGGFINGTSESIGKSGLAWTISPFAICIGLILGGLIYAGRMRHRQYITMLQPILENFGRLPAFLVYLATLAGDLFWTASILNALGTTISVIIGLDVLTSVLVSAGVTILYTMIGQMISVAYTDLVQLFFIALGLILAIPFAILNDAVGDIGETSSQWLGSIEPDIASIAWIDLAIAMILGTIPWQSYFQRVLAVRSVNEAKVLSVLAGIGSLIFAVPPFIIGAISTSADWSNVSITSGLNPVQSNQSSMILPLVINEFTPLPVAIIGLGAVCGAVMSSMDSSILGSSSMFTHHVYKPILRRNAGDTELIWIQRIFIFIIGAGATAISLNVDMTIWGLFVLAADIVFVIVLPQLTCSLFFSKTNGYGAILAFFVGVVLRIGAGESTVNLPPFIYYPLYDYDLNEQGFPFRVMAFVASTLTLVLVSYLFRLIFKCGCLPTWMDPFNILEHGSVKYDLSKENPMFHMETFTDSVYRPREPIETYDKLKY